MGTKAHLSARSTLTVGEVAGISRDREKALTRLRRVDDALARLQEDYQSAVGGRPPILASGVVTAIKKLRRITNGVRP